MNDIADTQVNDLPAGPGDGALHILQRRGPMILDLGPPIIPQSDAQRVRSHPSRHIGLADLIAPGDKLIGVFLEIITAQPHMIVITIACGLLRPTINLPAPPRRFRKDNGIPKTCLLQPSGHKSFNPFLAHLFGHVDHRKPRQFGSAHRQLIIVGRLRRGMHKRRHKQIFGDAHEAALPRSGQLPGHGLRDLQQAVLHAAVEPHRRIGVGLLEVIQNKNMFFLRMTPRLLDRLD